MSDAAIGCGPATNRMVSPGPCAFAVPARMASSSARLVASSSAAVRPWAPDWSWRWLSSQGRDLALQAVFLGLQVGLEPDQVVFAHGGQVGAGRTCRATGSRA